MSSDAPEQQPTEEEFRLAKICASSDVRCRIWTHAQQAAVHKVLLWALAERSESATPSFNDGLERAAAYVRSKPSEKREQIAIGILALKNATSQPQSKAACDPVGNVRIPAESASSSRCVAAAPRWTPVADGDGTAADQIAEPGEEITFYCLVRGDYYEYKITLPLFDERNGE